MVGHQAVSVYGTTRWKGALELVFWSDQVVEDEDEFTVVVIVFKHDLTVDAAEHHVMDAC